MLVTFSKLRLCLKIEESDWDLFTFGTMQCKKNTRSGAKYVDLVTGNPHRTFLILDSFYKLS